MGAEGGGLRELVWLPGELQDEPLLRVRTSRLLAGC